MDERRLCLARKGAHRARMRRIAGFLAMGIIVAEGLECEFSFTIEFCFLFVGLSSSRREKVNDYACERC